MTKDWLSFEWICAALFHEAFYPFDHVETKQICNIPAGRTTVLYRFNIASGVFTTNVLFIKPNILFDFRRAWLHRDSTFKSTEAFASRTSDRLIPPLRLNLRTPRFKSAQHVEDSVIRSREYVYMLLQSRKEKYTATTYENRRRLLRCIFRRTIKQLAVFCADSVSFRDPHYKLDLLNYFGIIHSKINR